MHSISLRPMDQTKKAVFTKGTANRLDFTTGSENQLDFTLGSGNKLVFTICSKDKLDFRTAVKISWISHTVCIINLIVSSCNFWGSDNL